MKHPPRHSSALQTLLACLSFILLGPGCHGSGKIVEGQQYPVQAQHGPTLNIQVFRRETEIEFTNTTAEPLPPSVLWLNAWYSRPFEGLAIGKTTVIPLREFKDRYGDSFRAGGFFASELPDRVALAEVQTEGKMVGLVVVSGEAP